MPKTIAICNQKGGVTKTTTTLNLGVGLARQGKKELLVDADPQADLTAALGWQNSDALSVTLADTMSRAMYEQNPAPADSILHHREDVACLVFAMPLFMVNALVGIVLVVIGVVVAWHFTVRPNDLLKDKTAAIIREMPRFVRTFVHGLKADADVLNLLQKYAAQDGALKSDIEILIGELQGMAINNGIGFVGTCSDYYFDGREVAMSRSTANGTVTLSILIRDVGYINPGPQMMKQLSDEDIRLHSEYNCIRHNSWWTEFEFDRW